MKQQRYFIHDLSVLISYFIHDLSVLIAAFFHALLIKQLLFKKSSQCSNLALALST